MAIMSSKAVIAAGTLTAVGMFYDEAITAAKEFIGKAQATVTGAEMSQFDRHLAGYWDMHGAPPKDMKRILKQGFDASGSKDALTDYWNNAYVLESLPDGYLILSKGPDGKRETADDLYILRRGRNVESRLRMEDDPGEMLRDFKELAEKQGKMARERRESQSKDDS